MGQQTPNRAMTLLDRGMQVRRWQAVSHQARSKTTELRVASMAVAALFTVATCASCATGARFSGRIQTHSSPEISVVRAVAHYKATEVVVDGDVRRPNGYAGVVPGYLKVEGLDASGKVIAATRTQWGEFNSRRFRLAYFRAVLPAPEPLAIASIVVEPVTGSPK